MSLKDRMNTDIYVEEKMDETFVRKQIINVLIVGICITAAMAAYYFNPIIPALLLFYASINLNTVMFTQEIR